MRMRGRDDQLWFQAHRQEHRRGRPFASWLLLAFVFAGLLFVLIVSHWS